MVAAKAARILNTRLEEMGDQLTSYEIVSDTALTDNSAPRIPRQFEQRGVALPGVAQLVTVTKASGPKLILTGR